MKWFQLSTQWTQTIADLEVYITSPISVTILEAPYTMHSNRQTPLDSLLKCVLDNYSKKGIQAVKRALQNVARARSNNQLEEFPRDWRKLTIEEWDNWAHNFTGKMHCEAMLACLRRMDLGSAQHMSNGHRTELQAIAKKLQVSFSQICISFHSSGRC